MKKLLYILKNRPGILLFMAASIAGALLLFWFFGCDDKASEKAGLLSGQEADIKAGELEQENIEGIYQESMSHGVPAGFKAVNLPVNFFGDHAVLGEGDFVDIISTYYNRETGIICSEKIISDKEIINLDFAGPEGNKTYMPIGDSIIQGDIYLSGKAIDICNILLITFFMRDDEVLRSFTALESGILYLSLCPGSKESGRN